METQTKIGYISNESNYKKIIFHKDGLSPPKFVKHSFYLAIIIEMILSDSTIGDLYCPNNFR